MNSILMKCFLLLFVCISISAKSDKLPVTELFPIGEELEYSLKWGPFKVGKGYLRVHPIEEINGIPCYHLNLSVSTNSFADVIYKVRNEFHSYVSIDDPKVILYRINQHEGSTDRDATVFFNWTDYTATYQRDGEEPKEPVEIGEYTWDPLSVVYYLRNLLDESIKESSLPATDGKKYLSIDIKNLGIVSKETQLGSFKAFKIEPNTKEMKGVFQKSKNSKILMWYSFDENRYPILIKSKVIVGSFIAELKKVSQLDGD